jgi:uncharacterized membrane protein YkoI
MLRLGPIFFTAAMIALGSFITGCSDSATDPGQSTNTPPASDATVEVSDPVSAGEANSVRQNVQQTSQDSVVITPQQAATTASAGNAGATVLGVNLDYDQNVLAYEVIIRTGNRIRLVVIDPKTGQIRQQTDIANAYYITILVLTPNVIRPSDASNDAKHLVDSSVVVENNLEQIDGRPTYVVILLRSDNRYVTIYLDAETGKQRKISDKDDCDGEGDTHANHRGRGHYRHGNGHGYGHHFHCLFPDNGGNDGGNGGQGQLPSGIITIDSARAIVRAMSHDSITFVRTQIELGKDSTVWYEFAYVKADSSRYEVTLDAFTGSVVRYSQTSGNFTVGDLIPTVKGDSLVALSVARTAALAAYAGTIQSWTLEKNTTEAKWVYTFEVKSATGVQKDVLIDAKTGTLIRVQ